MIRKTRINVTVLQMGRHFLYLPVYYALYNKLFDYLPGIDSTLNFQVTGTPSNEKTDKAVFEALEKNAVVAGSDIYFAIGDPRSIVERNWSKSRIRLIGALITGTPFWAINHGRNKTRTIKQLLEFNSIASYERGTTSYDLIQSALMELESDIPRSFRIKEIRSNQEFQHLEESSTRDDIVISPDILRIIQSIKSCDGLHQHGDNSYNIEFSFGSDYKLCDLLTTAIATSDDVIKKHPDLVKAFIKGVQRSLNELHARSPEILDYAAEKFRASKQDIIEALNYADESQVFPFHIGISEALWLRAHTGAIRADGKRLREEDILNAMQAYALIGKNTEQLVRDSVMEAFQDKMLINNRTVNYVLMPRLDLAGLAFLVPATTIIALFHKSNYHATFGVISIVLVWYIAGQIFFIPRISQTLFHRLVYWFCGSILIFLLVRHIVLNISTDISSVFLSILMLLAPYLINHFLQSHKS